MKKFIAVIFILVLFVLSCKSSIELARKPRIKFKQSLFVLPYSKAEKNVGFDDPDTNRAFAMVYIKGKNEDLLIEKIISIFNENKIFSHIVKIKNKSAVPKSENNWIFYLDNKFLRVDKSGLNYHAWIKTQITIDNTLGKKIFSKKYSLHVYATFSEIEQIALWLYEELINKLISDLEKDIAGLQPYTKNTVDKHPVKKGKL